MFQLLVTSSTCDAQQMASLQEERIMPPKSAFTDAGASRFGPFTVRRGRTTAERYGVLSTCLAIRAVHIEVVYSLDTESFIRLFDDSLQGEDPQNKLRQSTVVTS